MDVPLGLNSRTCHLISILSTTLSPGPLILWVHNPLSPSNSLNYRMTILWIFRLLANPLHLRNGKRSQPMMALRSHPRVLWNILLSDKNQPRLPPLAKNLNWSLTFWSNRTGRWANSYITHLHTGTARTSAYHNHVDTELLSNDFLADRTTTWYPEF